MLRLQPLAVVFDLDGTLIDSGRDIAAAVNHALSSSGRTPLSVQAVARLVGDGSYALVQRATGLHAGDELTQLHARFLDYYTQHPAVYTTAYPGVHATLHALRSARSASGRLKMAVCTNKPRATTAAVLQQLGLIQYFDAVHAAEDSVNKKPHPEPLLRVAQLLGVDAASMAMIGDGPQDVLCGKGASAMTVGVTYGLRPTEMLQSCPDVVIDAFPLLLDLLQFTFP